MTSGFAVTEGDRARWQRQAAGELARILDAHPEMPGITWTVGPAGCLLAGQVSKPAAARPVRDVFTAWRAALGLEDYREQPGSGAQLLHAAARRHGVTVRLIARVFDDEPDGW